MKRIAHTEPLTRIELLIVRNSGKVPRPILPLESDNEDAFKNSPLYSLTQPEDDLSEVAAKYLGPGPWTITSNLKLPASCRRIHMTNRNRRSNIVITHLLKCVIRVERGDDLHVDSKSGKRRLFDITAQVPIQILSVRPSMLSFFLNEFPTLYASVDATRNGHHYLRILSRLMMVSALHQNALARSPRGTYLPTLMQESIHILPTRYLDNYAAVCRLLKEARSIRQLCHTMIHCSTEAANMND
jgi:hypothetical protein